MERRQSHSAALFDFFLSIQTIGSIDIKVNQTSTMTMTFQNHNMPPPSYIPIVIENAAQMPRFSLMSCGIEIPGTHVTILVQEDNI